MIKKINNIKNDIAIYQAEDGKLSFNVNVFEDTVWLTQKQMAELFDKSVKTINEHIINSFDDEEIEKISTIRKFQIVQKEGSRNISREVEHYNLDVIISVGYRVKSKRGIQFRKWATDILKQYMLDGYAVNDVRIKQIESSIYELVASDKIQKEEISEIKDLLKRLIDRPIIINNHHQINNNLSLSSKELEDKIIYLIDKVIDDLKDNKEAKTQLEEVKSDISELPQNSKAKNRVAIFFKDMGDSKSEIYKTIKGAGIAKNVISEFVKLGVKLKDLM